MAKIGTNILLPIAAVLSLGTVGGLVYKAASKPTSVVVDSGSPLSRAPQPTSPDADSPADTIRSLRGQVEKLQLGIDEVSLHNDELVQKNKELVKDRDQLASEISSQLDSAMAQQANESDVRVSTIESSIQGLNTAMQSLANQVEKRLADVEQNTEVPLGLGLGDAPLYESGTTINGSDATNLVWINPLDVPEVATAGEKKGAGFVPEFIKTASGKNPVSNFKKTNYSSVANPKKLISSQSATEAKPEPWFTLPDLSVGVDSTSLTALIGKIYLDEEIKNPYPFKIIVGRENLTANFHDLPPEIEGMLFEGYATGDWPLSCVRGTLNAATFIFDDGTVRSAYPGDAGSRPKEAILNVNSIGYISDSWGNPCVKGKRVTDAPKFLFQRALLAGAEGYAAALKAEHIDTQTYRSPDGTSSTLSTFVGDAAEYAAASAYHGAIEETTDWIKERQEQSFDAIYVPSGHRVVFNLQQELRLDKLPDNRKITHQIGVSRHATLD